MNWFVRKLLDWLYEYYNQKEQAQVEVLKRQLDLKAEEIKKLKDDISEMGLSSLAREQELQAIIQELKDEDYETPKPDWIEGKMLYRPKRRFISKTKDLHRQFKKPQHAFDKSRILYDLLEKNDLLNVKKTVANMEKIQKLITGSITYEHDKEDNWRPISDVLIFGFGDCDDSGGIAITSAMGMAGWKADETFCWCGYYYPKGKDIDASNRFGHAWNITKCNGKWYVLEGTDSTAKPVEWEKVKNKYEGSWGGCNWKFEGMIKDGKKSL
jgi:transglutaminase-like putative cysteine protease